MWLALILHSTSCPCLYTHECTLQRLHSNQTDYFLGNGVYCFPSTVTFEYWSPTTKTSWISCSAQENAYHSCPNCCHDYKTTEAPQLLAENIEFVKLNLIETKKKANLNFIDSMLMLISIPKNFLPYFQLLIIIPFITQFDLVDIGYHADSLDVGLCRIYFDVFIVVCGRRSCGCWNKRFLLVLSYRQLGSRRYLTIAIG